MIEKLEDILHREKLKEDSKYYGEGNDLKPIDTRKNWDITNYKQEILYPQMEYRKALFMNDRCKEAIKVLLFGALYPFIMIFILALIYSL